MTDKLVVVSEHRHTVMFSLWRLPKVHTRTLNVTESGRCMVKLKTVICIQQEEHLVGHLPSNGCSLSCVNNLLMCSLCDTHMHEHTLLIFLCALQPEQAASSHHVQCTVQ